jgi:4-amino-4-deoxy-L-arabinose transferase-like glycosyltransferase
MAFAVRALALWGVSGATPLLDERTYLLRAHALLDGEGFVGSYQTWVRHDEADPTKAPQYPGAFQPPGYTAFIAGVMAVSGRSVTAVKFAQLLLGTLTVLLVYALGRAWFDARHGLVAAWICALYPNLIAFSHYLWSETLYTLLLVCAVWLLTRRPQPPQVGAAIAAGVVLGMAALTRSAIVYFVPVLMIWLALAHRPWWRSALARGALVLTVCLLTILPWTIRNHRIHDGWVLVDTNGAYNVWRGNGPAFFELRKDPRLPRYAWPFESLPLYPVGDRQARWLVRDVKRELGVDQPTDLEVARAARQTAWRSIREDPTAFLRRAAYKISDLWNPTSFLLRHFVLGAYGDVSDALRGTVSWAAILAYLGVMAFAVVGAVGARRDPRTWLVLLLLLFVTGIGAVAFGLTRFRLPLVPLLSVLAAHGILAVVDRRAGRRHA